MGGVSDHRGIVGIQDTSSSVKHGLTDPQHRFSVIAFCKPRRIRLVLSGFVRPTWKPVQLFRQYKLSSSQLSSGIHCLRNSTFDLFPSTTLKALCLLPELSTIIRFIPFPSITLQSLSPLLFVPTDKSRTSITFFKETTPPLPVFVTTSLPVPPSLLSKKPFSTYRPVATMYSMSSLHPMSFDDSNPSLFKRVVDLRPPLLPPLSATYVNNRNCHRSQPFHLRLRLSPKSLNPFQRFVSHTHLTTTSR